MAVRVLWLVKGLGPGGAEHLLAGAAEAHDVDKFDIECAFVVPAKDHLAERLEHAGVRCHCLSKRHRDGAWPQRLRRLIVDGQWDVVHAHSPLLAAAARVVVRSMPTATRPAMVTTEHNEWNTFAAPTRLVNRMTADFDDERFAVSESTRRSMSRRAATHSTTLHHGIDVERIAAQRVEREEVRAELGIDAGEFVIGTVANYREQKDYPNLLRATRALVDAGAAVRVVAVGQGPLAAAVSDLVTELGLDDVVILTGHRQDATRVMAGVDVFTLASFHEGLPVALMEALALGLPIVATAVGGVTDVLTDGVDALLVAPRDPGALAGAWKRLYDDAGLRRRLARRSSERGPEFDVDSSIAVLEATYRTLARGTEAPPRPVARTSLPVGITVRPAEIADREDIVELCRVALDWPTGPLADEMFAWKHDDNAFGRSVAFVATHADRIVGFRTFMPWEFRRGEETLSAVRAVDTATAPDMQGRGVFRSLTLHGLDALRELGVDFVFNTPNAQSLPGYLSMGWREVGRLPTTVRFMGPRGLAAGVRSRVPAELLSSPSTIGLDFTAWIDERSGSRIQPDGGGLDDARSLSTVWTDDRLRWRFGGSAVAYRVVPGHRPGTGVVVRERTRGDAHELVSLLALGLDIGEADRVVVEAAGRTAITHVVRLGAASLRRAFVPMPGVGPVLAWRGLRTRAMPPLSAWSLTMADVELF